MASSGHGFVEWKEQFVSQERGNRIVHYLLKDSAGDSILAVVGTERSVRHMVYVVADEFLNAYGDGNSIQAGFKWRSKREVVDWLTSMLSKQHLLVDQSMTALQRNDPMQAIGSSKFSKSGFQARHTIVRGHNSDIEWSGIAWTCGKQLKHYPAFSRNGITIMIQSFVFVMANEGNHYLAYVEDMYEDKKGQRKVKVRWFHRNQEIKGVIPVENSHPKEVFITPYAQVISAECIDGPAIVLTQEHYEQCSSIFPNDSLARIHFCFRQFRNNRVKPFNIGKLRGYLDQPILSCLNPDPFSKEEGEEDLLYSNKRARCGLTQMIMSDPSCRNLMSGRFGRKLVAVKHSGPLIWHNRVFTVNEKIELLSQDSGIRGCWFRCTVMQVSKKHLKVQYDDVQDEDGSGNLQEWIPSFRLAMPDKLRMRCSGRQALRPIPNGQTDLICEVGAAVDAWWSDGWWEGVIIGIDDWGNDSLQVYIPGESLFLNVQRRNVRLSRDWVGGQWVDINPKPDILSLISLAISLDTKLSTSSTSTKSEPEPDRVGVRLDTVEEEEKLNLSASGSSDVEWVNNKQQPSVKGEDSNKGNGSDTDNDDNEAWLEVEKFQSNEEKHEGELVEMVAEKFQANGEKHEGEPVEVVA